MGKAESGNLISVFCFLFSVFCFVFYFCFVTEAGSRKNA